MKSNCACAGMDGTFRWFLVRLERRRCLSKWRILCSGFFSGDTAADEERKKVIKKFQRWFRFPANDRSVPASDQQ